MLTKAQIKHIQSLQRNKFRRQHQQFVVEGDKMVREMLQEGAPIVQLYALEDWLNENGHLAGNDVKTQVISEQELKSISGLVTPNAALAILKTTEHQLPNQLDNSQLYIALDGIQDPGNMGTIIRTADWFGIGGIICSTTCVDIYNPKVVQATMSSIIRVPIWQADLSEALPKKGLPVLVADMDGQSINEIDTQQGAIVVIGNEGNGVSEAVRNLSTGTITIPRKGQAESLNAAMAAGIIMNHYS